MFNEILNLQDNSLMYRRLAMYKPSIGVITTAEDCNLKVKSELGYFYIFHCLDDTCIKIWSSEFGSILNVIRSFPLEKSCVVYFDDYCYKLLYEANGSITLEVIPSVITVSATGSPIQSYDHRHEVLKYHNLDEDSIFGLSSIYNPSSLQLVLDLFQNSKCSLMFWNIALENDILPVLNNLYKDMIKNVS